MELPVGPIVAVVWRDAHFNYDDNDRPEDYLVTTVGIQLDDEGPFVVLAMERTPDETRAITRIPTSLIQHVYALTPGEVAPEVFGIPA